MSVKLLAPHKGLPAQFQFSSDALTERSLVAAGLATYDLSGAIEVFEPGAPFESLPTRAVRTSFVKAEDIQALGHLGPGVQVEDEKGAQYLWDGTSYKRGEGALSGTVQDGLLVTTFNDQQYALLPVTGPGAIEANLVPRTGSRETLETLAGEAGEIASINDERGIMLFTGSAGQARGVYSTNAGRTVVVSLPPVPYTGPVIELGPDVLEVHFRFSSPPTDVRDPDQTPNPQVRFTGARTTAQRVRVFQEYPVVFLAGVNGGPDCSLSRIDGGRNWSELLLDTTTTPPTYRAFSSAYAESSESPEVFAPGSVRLGSEAYAFGRLAIALGNGAVANMASEIAFGSPRTVRFGGIESCALAHRPRALTAQPS